LIATVALRIITARLDLSVGRSGPHDFAVRTCRARLAQPVRPSHPASYVRDDREAPLLWSGMGDDIHVIFISVKANIFAARLDTNSENQPVGQISWRNGLKYRLFMHF
jgi:hypothetical protein